MFLFPELAHEREHFCQAQSGKFFNNRSLNEIALIKAFATDIARQFKRKKFVGRISYENYYN
jgi:hypothetical protein